MTSPDNTAWYRGSAAVICLVASWRMIFSTIQWRSMEGWEAYSIARAIAAGNGYSFPSADRWLFDRVSDGVFHPTAWVDPLYTYILAGLIWLFGDYHQLAASILNLILFAAVFVLTYRLAERLISSSAGVAAVLLLAVSRFSTMPSYMYNTLLAAALILVSSLVLVRYFEAPSHSRAAVLGLALGFTVLACPSAQLFIWIAAVSVAFWGRDNLKRAVPRALLVVAGAALVMSPWVVRNYLVFDEYISVRNGGGQIAFIGSVAAAATVAPESIDSDTKPSWTAETAREAIFEIYRVPQKKEALVPFQLDYGRELGPPEWPDMNEAQRDQWYFAETKSFLVEHPLLSIRLAFAKAIVFVGVMGWIGAGVILMAVLGALLAMKNPALMTLAACVASFAGPFLLVVAYYVRYRAPVEPLFTVLAVFAVFWALDRPFLRSRLVRFSTLGK